MKNIPKMLNSRRLKATPQRIAIYTYLLQSSSHPNAETIYNALKEDYPAMSLATVYKTVASLRDAGLVKELNVGEDSFRYDACTKEHMHVICRKCRRVYDYDRKPDTEQLALGIKEKLDVDVDSCMMFFYGVCGDCAKKTTSDEESKKEKSL